MTQRHRAVWVSTSVETRGGIATFVRTMRQTRLWSDWEILHIATHRDGSIFVRVLTFVRGAVTFVSTLVVDRPDVVHLHTASYGSFLRKAVLLWISRVAGVPVVVHVHGAEFEQFHDRCPRVVRRVIRETLEHANVVVALGDSWRCKLARIAPSARIVVVPNSVRPRLLVPQSGEHDCVHVAFLGRVGKRKGVFVLLEAWAKVLADGGGGGRALLTIAGDGEVDRARCRVSELGLHDSVTVLGWLPPQRAAQLLDRSQVFVLPSLDEGQPMAVLEAMARGICIVASDAGGIPDLIDDTCAVVVPAGDVDALTVALRRVLSDRDGRSRLGRSAWTRASTDFDVDVISRRFDALYREVQR